MDFGRLKELVRKLGGILVFDGGEPEFVILPYEQYEKIEAGEDVPFSTRRNGLARTSDYTAASEAAETGAEDPKTVEILNREISALKEEIRQKEEAELVADDQSAEPTAEAAGPDPFLD